MSEYIVPDHGCVTNTHIYGLDESIKRAKYPYADNLDTVTYEFTNTIKTLAASEPGRGEDQFLTGIVVQFDLTLPVKVWVEAERYHFLDFVSSQSTMHRIAKFDLDKQYSDYVDPRCIAVMKELVCRYNETGDKQDYLRALYTNPCGMRLTAGITTNYRQLKTIYFQRKNHRLPEWRELCEWIETLPRVKDLFVPKSF